MWQVCVGEQLNEHKYAHKNHDVNKGGFQRKASLEANLPTFQLQQTVVLF